MCGTHLNSNQNKTTENISLVDKQGNFILESLADTSEPLFLYLRKYIKQ